MQIIKDSMQSSRGRSFNIKERNTQTYALLQT